MPKSFKRVALRKESVDRNDKIYLALAHRSVALRKESVDRNRAVNISCARSTSSLSARRAWIEIILGFRFTFLQVVALRKESVDRNPKLFEALSHVRVALRKESVDRNFDVRYTASPRPRSLSARRAWIEISITI